MAIFIHSSTTKLSTLRMLKVYQLIVLLSVIIQALVLVPLKSGKYELYLRYNSLVLQLLEHLRRCYFGDSLFTTVHFNAIREIRMSCDTVNHIFEQSCHYYSHYSIELLLSSRVSINGKNT